MKILLTFFVLLFSTSVLAEDISDFEIEGISVGDSLLDYMSEAEIKKFSMSHYYPGSDKQYLTIEFYKGDTDILKIYDLMQITYKNNNKFIIFMNKRIFKLIFNFLFRHIIQQTISKTHPFNLKV